MGPGKTGPVLCGRVVPEEATTLSLKIAGIYLNEDISATRLRKPA